MKYFWLIIIFLVCFSFFCGLLNHPVYHWKDTNIIVKELKEWEINGNKIVLLYVKNNYTNTENLAFCFKMNF